MSGRPYKLKFRAWLVQWLSETVHFTLGRTEEMAQLHAERLGVHPSVLREAYALAAERSRAAALRPSLGSMVAGSGHNQLKVYMPERIWQDWQAWCEAQHLPSSTVLRSLLHQYLLGSREPSFTGTHWTYRGERYAGRQRWGEPGTVLEQALITAGARIALNRRVARLGSSAHAVVRGLIVDLIEGRIAGVHPLDARTMWDDPNRYWVPPESLPKPEKAVPGDEAVLDGGEGLPDAGRAHVAAPAAKPQHELVERARPSQDLLSDFAAKRVGRGHRGPR